jgi:hypothetical protein
LLTVEVGDSITGGDIYAVSAPPCSESGDEHDQFALNLLPTEKKIKHSLGFTDFARVTIGYHIAHIA